MYEIPVKPFRYDGVNLMKYIGEITEEANRIIMSPVAAKGRSKDTILHSTTKGKIGEIFLRELYPGRFIRVDSEEAKDILREDHRSKYLYGPNKKYAMYNDLLDVQTKKIIEVKCWTDETERMSLPNFVDSDGKITKKTLLADEIIVFRVTNDGNDRHDYRKCSYRYDRTIQLKGDHSK